MYPLTAILLNVSCAKLPRQIHNSARPWKKLPSCSFALLRQKTRITYLLWVGLFSGNCKRSLTFIPWGMTVQHPDCIPWLNTLCVLWMHWAQKSFGILLFEKVVTVLQKGSLEKGKKSCLVTRGMLYVLKYLEGFLKF